MRHIPISKPPVRLQRASAFAASFQWVSDSQEPKGVPCLGIVIRNWQLCNYSIFENLKLIVYEEIDCKLN